MATSILQPSTIEGASANIIVTEGNSKLISLYTDTGDDIPYGVVLKLQRLTVAGYFENVSTTLHGPVLLKKDNKTVIINGVGTYRVYRPDISEFGVNVGVQEG